MSILFKKVLAISALACVLVFGCANSYAMDEFIVADIRIDGLKRVSAGTVFSDFTISAGDKVDQQRIVAATKNLFKTGLFTDLKIKREGRDLIVEVFERPAISKIEITGNKNISEDWKILNLSSPYFLPK